MSVDEIGLFLEKVVLEYIVLKWNVGHIVLKLDFRDSSTGIFPFIYVNNKQYV